MVPAPGTVAHPHYEAIYIFGLGPILYPRHIGDILVRRRIPGLTAGVIPDDQRRDK